MIATTNTTNHVRHRCITLSSRLGTSAPCRYREALGFPVVGPSESIKFSVARIYKLAKGDLVYCCNFGPASPYFKYAGCNEGSTNTGYDSTNPMNAGFQF